jgi:hypoxia up-regulated 1
MGGEFFKASIIRPGAAPIEILLNKESKRKTPTAVSFMESIRAFGNDAMAHATRKPTEVVQGPFRNLGVSKESMISFDSKYYPMKYEENERGMLDVVVKGEKIPLEVATAHIIGNILTMAKESDNPSTPKETVVTIPMAFTQRQRQAVVNAATVAGLKVKALVGETVATAVQKAVDYSPKNETQIMIVNIGSTHAEICIVEFSSRAAGMVAGRTAPVLRNLGCAEDTQIGGHYGDLKLADHAMELFLAKNPKFGEAKNSIRAWRKLLAQAIKSKTTLSANKEAPFSIESMYEDTDFFTLIKRDKLEELGKDMLDRIPTLVEKALLEANTTMEKIAGSEVVGGAWRQPAVLSLITKMVGMDENGKPKEIGQHLNGEEAAALGSVLVGANHSTQFRIKKIFFQDIHSRGFAIEVTRLDNETHTMMLSKDDPASMSLVEKGSPMTKKKLVLKECPCYNDMKIDLYENQGDKQVHLTTYEVRGVKEAVDKRITNSKYNLTNITKDMPKVVVWLSGDTNNTGIVTISKAEILIEGSYWLEVNETRPKAKNGTNETTTETPAEGSEETKPEEEKAEGEEKSEEPKEGEEKAEDKAESKDNASNASGNASNKSDPLIEYETITVMKKKVKKFTDNLKLVVVEHNPRPMNNEELHAAIEGLKAAQQKDDDARKLDSVANEVEAYIYGTRDKLESESWIGVTTEEIRTELSTLLTETDEWLQDSNPERTLQDFEGKLQALQGKADPIQERALELEYRPDVVDWVKDELEEAQKWQEILVKNMTWIESNKTQKVAEKIEEFTTWWTKVQEKQKTTPVHEAPAFTREEVRTRMKTVTSEIEKLKKIPKPKEKKEKKDKGKGKEKKKDKKKDKSKKEPVDTTGYDIEKATAELARIETEKSEAIKAEDYDKAETLKKEKDKFQAILEALKEAPEAVKVDTTGYDVAKAEAEIAKLEEEKAAAIAEENYDKAEELKKKKTEVQEILKALKEKTEL